MQPTDPQTTPDQASPAWRNFMPGEDEEVDLGEYLGVLLDARWLIAAITLAVGLLAGAYAFLATPIYQADALLQVEEKQSQLGGLEQLEDVWSTKSSIDAEIEIIRTRTVLGQVVDELDLHIGAPPPHPVPLVSSLLIKLGLRDEATIRVGGLDVPDQLLNEPLQLTATGNGGYTLADGDGNAVLNGQVGQRAAGHGVSIFVSQLSAEAGAEFNVTRRRRADIIRALQQRLQISEKGRQTGIVQIVYTSANPQRARAVVDALAHAYLRQNVERKSAEAEKALKFLEEQLPAVKAQMAVAENALNRYRLEQGSVDITMETKGVLDQAIDLERQLSKLQMDKTELRQRFTEQHPLVKTVDEQATRIREDKRLLEEKIKALPQTEQELIRLTRDVQVNTELYTFLLNKAQELKIARAGIIGDVRILDLPVLPYRPVKPKKARIVALGLVLGLFGAVFLVLVRRAMNRTVEDSRIVEQATGLALYAGIPHSDQQNRLNAAMRRHKDSADGTPRLLARAAPNDMAIESMRSLRTNLHFALMDAPNKRVVITGVAPGVGKSFVTANFATVLADAGQRVLVVDGDMRRGHLHQYYGCKREPGLSDVVAGDLVWREAVQETGTEGLHLLASGTIPPNPSELLMHEQFQAVMDEVSTTYDVVLMDTPPVLAVTDAVINGKCAGSCFLLLRSGRHALREIEEAVKHLENGGVPIQGYIFNDIMPRSRYYGYGRDGYHYQYDYRSDGRSNRESDGKRLTRQHQS